MNLLIPFAGAERIEFISPGAPVGITSGTSFPFVDEHLDINPPVYLLEKIDKFISLKDNWDGYGGIALLPQIASIGKKLVNFLSGEELEKVTDIFSNSHGTLTIEWENSDGEKLALEIGKENYSYFVRCNNTKPIIVDGKDILQNIKGIKEALGQLFGKD